MTRGRERSSSLARWHAPRRQAGRRAGTLALGTLLSACASAPSPLQPFWHGSIGAPTCGVLSRGAELPSRAPGLSRLRDDDRGWGQPRLVAAIERAAAEVDRERPGGTLTIGDLSSRTGGGPALPHFSHRSGMDADLLFYMTDLDGAPATSHGFYPVGSDGLARDASRHRWLRLDVDREWLLIRALLLDPGARVQWIFVSDVVRALVTEWARARGEPLDLVARAQTVMLQPGRGGVHDDHLHVRSACSAEEEAAGCARFGPARPWLDEPPAPQDASDADLAQALAAAAVPGPSEAP